MAEPSFPFAWGRRTYLMGILNVTPDSFSGDGILQQDHVVDAALEQARRCVLAGADVLDIGGESTRPGALPVDEAEELQRILPVLHAIVRAGLDVCLSLDTYKAAVAQAALQIAPSLWINDIWGLRADPELAPLVARSQAPVIIMHNRLKPATTELQARLGGRYIGAVYEDLLADIKRELMESVSIAHQAGIQREKIILDPGIGFGKTVEQNLQLIDRLDEICALGYPVLLGTSRKSFIGYTLNLPPEERLEGTAAAVAIGIARGVDLVRVHEMQPLARVARMSDAIVRKLV